MLIAIVTMLLQFVILFLYINFHEYFCIDSKNTTSNNLLNNNRIYTVIGSFNEKHLNENNEQHFIMWEVYGISLNIY